MNKRSAILIACILEGASLMAMELCAARLLIPIFGGTSKVWAVVLAITVGGLAVGYYLGSVFSGSIHRMKILKLVLLISIVYTLLEHSLIKAICINLSHLNFEIGLILSAILVIFVPMSAFGIVSPVAATIIANNPNETAKLSGLIYMLSTVGGILSTFIFGLFVLPIYGLQTSFYLITFLLFMAFISLNLIKNETN